MSKLVKSWIGMLLLIPLMLTACEAEDIPDVWIAPVEHTVSELPPLPERTRMTVTSYRQVLAKAKETKQKLEDLGGQIDIAIHYSDSAYLDCQRYFDVYQEIAELPKISASGADELTQWAADQYNEAIENILDTSQGMYLNCGAALMGTAKDEPVPFHQWGLSRSGAAEAVEIFEATIRRLEEEDFDANCETIMTLPRAMRCTRKQMERFGGVIDQAVDTGKLNCQKTVDIYDSITDMPTFEVSGSDALAQYAYDSYRQSIDIFSTNAEGMVENCRHWLSDPYEDGTIPFQQWGLARKTVNESLEILIPAIERFEK